MIPLGDLTVQIVNGIYFGAILFLIASGLTIVFGILGVLNLAHGQHALGAYIGVTVFGYLTAILVEPSGIIGMILLLGIFLAGVIATALILVPVGVIMEAVFLRPIYERREFYQLLLTYAFLLLFIDVMKFGWGGLPRSTDWPYSSINQIPTLEIFGFSYPSYNILVILLSVVVFLSLIWFFNKTKKGRIIRATAIDRKMATAIGVSTDRTFTLVFALGAFFAGFGGALAVSQSTASLDMGMSPLILSFVVIVIGGLGSIRGAFVASMVVGVMSVLAVVVYPPIELAAPFALMAVILLIKPEGLFGTWGEIA